MTGLPSIDGSGIALHMNEERIAVRRDGTEPGVSLIIPTTCEEGRKELLRRAIGTVLFQTGIDIDLIVVVNGNRVDEAVYQELCEDGRFDVRRRQVASLPAALKYGRGLVKKEYFGFLDDDDELLPGAMTKRCRVLQEDESIDAVVGNGYVTRDGVIDEPYRTDWQLIDHDPLRALLKENWLASCGALFRSSTIPSALFDEGTKYYEWTLLAIKLLVANKKFAFLDEPTFRIHQEVEQSLSKSAEYSDAYLEFLFGLLDFELPKSSRRELKRKISRSLHCSAESRREQGRLIEAWKYHLRSIWYSGLWSYGLYTRKLFTRVR